MSFYFACFKARDITSNCSKNPIIFSFPSTLLPNRIIYNFGHIIRALWLWPWPLLVASRAALSNSTCRTFSILHRDQVIFKSTLKLHVTNCDTESKAFFSLDSIQIFFLLFNVTRWQQHTGINVFLINLVLHHVLLTDKYITDY